MRERENGHEGEKQGCRVRKFYLWRSLRHALEINQRISSRATGNTCCVLRPGWSTFAGIIMLRQAIDSEVLVLLFKGLRLTRWGGNISFDEDARPRDRSSKAKAGQTVREK